MIKQKDRWRKIFSILLILSLILTNIFTFPNSYAKTEIISDDADVDDLAYYDIWKHADDTWQYGKQPGSQVSGTFTIKEGVVPEGATITSITGDYNSGYSGDWLQFCVLSGNTNVSDIDYIVGQVKDSEKASIEYTVKTKLTLSSGDNGYKIKKVDQLENVEGYRYYIPVTFHIEYTYEKEIEEPEIGDFQPDFILPTTAKQGETYSVMDDTTVDSNCTIDYATLEKHLGDSNWETVATWNGTGSAGQNTGKSKSESCDTICTVTYRLTVYDIYGKEKSVTKTISIQDNISVDAEADLELDEYTYEGHPAYARDVSVFDVDGETYNASRAYEEGVASNRFDVVQNTDYDIDRLSDTKAKVIFEKAGNYNVQLRVRTKDGKKLYDTEPIEVRKTPYIEANLGGTQKQNRLQILNMSACIHPDYPVADFWVEIEDVDTGEKVHLTSAKVNSTNIYTRDIQTNFTEYFNNFTLEFLTDNNVGKVYKYTAYVKDSKGDTDKVTELFTVHPDLPPTAVINMSDTFYRNEDSNTADIIVEDRTVSADGDQLERTWKVAFDTDHDSSFNDETYQNITLLGYKDLSFGSMKEIEFPKTGVGKANVRLDVKEVWTEPTLDEYVSDSDRLTGYTTAATEVKNIAPMVSLEVINTFKEGLFVLTTENKVADIESGKNTLDGLLKTNAIDGKLTVASFNEENASSEFLWSKTQDTPNKYESMDFGTVFTMDDNNFYRVKSTLTDDDSDGKLAETPPFVVEAFNNETGNLVWSYTLDDDYEKSRFRLINDDSDKYLYVVPKDRYSPQKIVVIDKTTGAFVTEHPFDYNYLYAYNSTYSKEDGEYYIKDDNLYILNKYGIKVFNLSDGTIKEIKNCEIYKSKMVKGKIHFGFYENFVNYRGILDLKTGNIDKQFLTSYGIEQGYSPYNTLGIDIYGNIVLRKGKEFLIYNIDNICIKRIESTLSSYDEYGVVTDTESKITHVYTFDEWRTSKDDLNENLYVAEIYGDRSNIYNYRDKSAWTYSGMMFKKSIDDKIYFLKAAERGEESCSSTDWKIDLDYTDDFSGTVGTDGNSGEYCIQTDNYVAYVQVKDLKYGDSYQRIHMNRMPSTLEGNINRALNKNAYFSDDYQKNVVIMDNEHSSNTDLMSKVIDSIGSMGAKFTSIGNSITGSNYLVKMKDELDGNAIYYNTYSMENNLLNLANVLNTNKEEPKNPVVNVSGNGNSNAEIYKQIELEAGQEYFYEYDINYTNKGSMTNADIFNINHSLSNTAYAGRNNVAVSTSNVEFENFENATKNPFFSYSGKWSDSEWKDGKLMYSTNYKEGGTGTEEISFTTDGTAILSFDYAYIFDSRYYRDKFKMTKFQVYIDDVEQHPVQLGSKIDDLHKFKFSKEISAGHHVLKLKYSQFERYSYQYAYIDNLKVTSVNKKSDGSYDAGQLNKDSQAIKENEWQHINGNIRTPYDVTQYAKISDKSKTIFEDFSDSNLNFNMSMEGHHVSGGVFRPIHTRGDNFGNYIRTERHPYCEPRVTSVTFSVPSGHVGYFGVWADGWHDDSGDQYGEIPELYSGDIEGYGNHDHIDPWELYSRKYNAGTHTVHFYSYSYYSKKKHRWDDGVLVLDNMFLKIQPVNFDDNTQFIDDAGNVYAKSKLYNEQSTVKLKYSSTKDSNFLIKNFKLYRLEDGKKVLQHEFNTLSQNQLDSVFDVIKYNAQINVINEPISEDEETPMVPIYAKGELVAYNVNYSDYENDPSKKQYWQYTHTPFNDGVHPDQGKILNAPIDRFYVDGKYVVKHWQEDATGVTDYDKLSNTEEITFYIQGNNATAPYVEYIKTLPSVVEEGESFKIETGVDDEEKDPLDVTVELYFNNRLIHTYTQNNLIASGDDYPAVLTDQIQDPAAGSYEIIVTVSDSTGTGLGSKKFVVKTVLAIDGMVNPNPCLAGERVYFACDTKGKGEDVEVFLDEFESGKSIMLTPDFPTSTDENVFRGDYIVPLETDDGTYDIPATVYKNGKTKSTMMQLTVKGNMYELVPVRIIDSN